MHILFSTNGCLYFFSELISLGITGAVAGIAGGALGLFGLCYVDNSYKKAKYGYGAIDLGPISYPPDKKKQTKPEGTN